MVGWIPRLVRTQAGFGRRVDGVARAGDRQLGKSLEPAWNVVQNPALWNLGLPAVAQGQLIAAARSSVGAGY